MTENFLTPKISYNKKIPTIDKLGSKVERVNLFDKEENKYGYVFSKNLKTDKYSNKYSLCTGVVINGENYNKEKISILSHQNTKFLYSNPEAKKLFLEDLKKEVIKIASESATQISILFFAGSLMSPRRFEGKNRELIKEYNRMYIEMISDMNKVVAGIDRTLSPIVACPKHENSNEHTDIFLDTKKNQIYTTDMDNYENNFFKSKNVLNFLGDLEKKSGVKFL